jgi:hypothetical protein
MRSRLGAVAAFALTALSCSTQQQASMRAAAAVQPSEIYCGENDCSWVDLDGACQFMAESLGVPGTFADVRLSSPVVGDNSVTAGGETYTVNLSENLYGFDWAATRPVTFVVGFSGWDGNAYVYPQPVTSDTGLEAWFQLPLTQVLFCVEPLAPPKGSLSAAATASAGFTRAWTWQIAKSSPTPTVTAAVGATVDIAYAVSVAVSSVDSGWSAGGSLTITNTSAAVAVAGVTVEASYAGAPVVPECPPAPFTVPAGGSVSCTWTAAPDAALDGVFVATVSSPEIAGPAGATATVVFGDPTAQPDGCVTVTDSLVGTLGTVCASATLAQGTAAQVAPAAFGYTYAAGPYATCDATNTAYSVSNTATYAAPSGKTGSSSVVVGVRVPCSTGCTLTQGYWKTHSQEGPAPYDRRWKLVGPLEEDTVFFLSGKTWIEVFRTPVRGSPYYALAHQYMAARLNVLAGASADALGGALASAEAFFAANGPATRLTAAQKAEVLALATLLDQFNSGKVGPGHCDDAESGGGCKGDDDGDREEDRGCKGDDDGDREEDRCHEGHDHDRHEQCRRHDDEDRAHRHCGDRARHDECRRHDGDDRKKHETCEREHEERRCRDGGKHADCRDHDRKDGRSED